MSLTLFLHYPLALESSFENVIAYGASPFLTLAKEAITLQPSTFLLDFGAQAKWETEHSHTRAHFDESALEKAFAEIQPSLVFLHYGQAIQLSMERVLVLDEIFQHIQKTGAKLVLVDTPAIIDFPIYYDPKTLYDSMPHFDGLLLADSVRPILQIMETGVIPPLPSKQDQKTFTETACLKNSFSLQPSEPLDRNAFAAPLRAATRCEPCNEYWPLPPIRWDKKNKQALSAHLAYLKESGIKKIDALLGNASLDEKALLSLVGEIENAGLTISFLGALNASSLTNKLAKRFDVIEGKLRIGLRRGMEEALFTETKAFDAFLSMLQSLTNQSREIELETTVGKPEDSIRKLNSLFRALGKLQDATGVSLTYRYFIDTPSRKLPFVQSPRSILEDIPAFFKRKTSEQELRLMTANFFHSRAKRATQEKLIINTTYKCNNHCIFCSIADRAIQHGDFETQKRHMEEARAAGVTLLDIDGGEPTLYPKLFDLLEYAVSIGFETITITTNGRLLSDASLVDKLRRYPVRLLISLHSTDEAIQDEMTTQKGSLRQTLRGIMNAKKRFPDLGVNTTIIRNNLESLPKLGALLQKLSIRQWNMQHYTPFGEVDAALAPDPHETGDTIKKLIDQFSKKLNIQVINLPFCFLDGYERFALQDYDKSVRKMLFVSGESVNLADFLAKQRFKNGKCDRCLYDCVCYGFWDYGITKATKTPYRIRMLDILPGYPCEAKCIFCAVEDSMLKEEKTTEEAIQEIERSAYLGPAIIRFGGGEPTEREDLPQLIEAAKRLEPEVISVQTHGFKLADESYLDALIKKGMNRVHISIRGADEKTHEALTGVKGSFDKLVEAVENTAKRRELKLVLDGILTKQTAFNLPEQLRFFTNLGAKDFNFWFVNAEGRAKHRWKDVVANMTKAATSFKEAADVASDYGAESLRVYYIPYCFLKGYERHVWHPLEENALVITPTSRFTLDKGTLDLGIHPPPCEKCAIRRACFGIQPSYVERFGDEEIKPYDKKPSILKD